MATENPVFQILAPTGNQALLAAGSRPDSLAVGQIGLFNYHTGLSIDGSVPNDARDIWIGVGQNITGAGAGATLEDIAKSAGQMIQARNATSVTLKPYLASVAKIVEFSGFIAKCETDYALKIEFRNQQAYANYGYNQFAKTFAYRTSCCTQVDCTACPAGDCNELAIALAAAINGDRDHLVTAILYGNKLLGTIGAPTADANTVVTIGTDSITVAVLDADTATQAAAKIVAAINASTTFPYKATSTGAIVTAYPTKSVSAPTAAISTLGAGVLTTVTSNVSTTVADVDVAAFKALYPGVCLSIRITSAPTTASRYAGSIPIAYYNAKDTDIIVTTTGSFDCNGTVTTIQDLQYEDGNGNNLAYDEYMAGGWNGKPGPYRTRAITGLEKPGFSSTIVKTSNYNQVVLTYNQFSVAGWGEHLNNLQTIIAIPCADGTTLAGLVAVTDLIFTNFGTMAGDVAANGGVDCTNLRTGLLTPATDGIESLA